jgi:hypothetical protein
VYWRGYRHREPTPQERAADDRVGLFMLGLLVVGLMYLWNIPPF